MALHNELGKLGETLAANFLQANGYTIVERNWRVNRIEIDLIARLDDTLIFVEVKTRSSDYFGSPEVFVTKRKKRAYGQCCYCLYASNRPRVGDTV